MELRIRRIRPHSHRRWRYGQVGSQPHGKRGDCFDVRRGIRVPKWRREVQRDREHRLDQAEVSLHRARDDHDFNKHVNFDDHKHNNDSRSNNNNKHINLNLNLNLNINLNLNVNVNVDVLNHHPVLPEQNPIRSVFLPPRLWRNPVA